MANTKGTKTNTKTNTKANTKGTKTNTKANTKGKKADTEENKEEKPRVPKSRVFNLILYPDNKYHMEILDYLKDSEIVSGCFILHRGEKLDIDEIEEYKEKHKVLEVPEEALTKKDHYHVIVKYNTPRSLESFINSFGSCYTWVQTDDKGKVLNASTEPVEGWQMRYNLILNKATSSINHDITAYCEYLLHRDFRSVRAGKTQYCISDVENFGNRHFFEKYYHCEEYEMQQALDEIEMCKVVGKDTPSMVYEELYRMRCFTTIAWISKHSAFVDRFVLGKRLDTACTPTAISSIIDRLNYVEECQKLHYQHIKNVENLKIEKKYKK